jgi:hypothetical protein
MYHVKYPDLLINGGGSGGNGSIDGLLGTSSFRNDWN